MAFGPGSVRVRLGEPQQRAGRVRAVAEVEGPGLGVCELFYEVADADASRLTTHVDPFVFAPLAVAMAGGHDLVVEDGPVDPVLLGNLAEFARIWSVWFGYRPPRIAAESRPGVAPRPGTVVAFSGGVDAACSLWRHTRGDLATERPVDAALMLHGLDVPLARPDAFTRAAARARRMTDDVGVPLIAVATNAWDLPVPVGAFTGMGVAAGLHALAGGFGTGLVPSTAAYRELLPRANSSAVSDHLLGGSDFAVVHDGADADRFAKVALLAGWSAALGAVRVCLHHAGYDDNCCECNKCMMTLTALHVLGVAAPAFACRPSATDIHRWARTIPRKRYFLDEGSTLVAEARRRRISEPWVGALARRIRWARLKDGVRSACPAASARIAAGHRRAGGWRRRTGGSDDAHG